MESEIPFTRKDMLIQLAGASEPLVNRFLKACAGMRETVLHETGFDLDPSAMLSAMASSPASYFHVPSYLHGTWHLLSEENSTKFYGVRTNSWDREFIVAHVSLSKEVLTELENKRRAFEAH